MSGFWRGAVTGLALGAVVAGVVYLLCRTPGVEAVEAKGMKEITIKVDSTARPKIPFARVPATADPQNPNHAKREVTFKTDRGTAWVVIPVEGKVFYASSEQVSLPSRVTVLKVDTNGATLVITEKNEQEIEVEYQVLCDDGKDQYWAEGQSPPRIIIPKW